MSEHTSKRRRLTRAIDVRTVIGVALVLGSVTGVWAVVASSDRSVPVYAAGSTIVAGDTVSPDDLVVRRVSLGSADELYASPGAVAPGSVATRTVFEGELVPAEALEPSADVGRAAVVVDVGRHLPDGVAEGRTVDVWSSSAGPEDEDAPPSVLVSGAVVSRVVQEDGLVAGDPEVSVELSVPDGTVAVLLAATASDEALALVPSTGGTE